MIGKISPAASPHPTVPRLWTSTRSGRRFLCTRVGQQLLSLNTPYESLDELPHNWVTSAIVSLPVFGLIKRTGEFSD